LEFAVPAVRSLDFLVFLLALRAVTRRALEFRLFYASRQVPHFLSETVHFVAELRGTPQFLPSQDRFESRAGVKVMQLTSFATPLALTLSVIPRFSVANYGRGRKTVIDGSLTTRFFDCVFRIPRGRIR